MPHQLSPKTSRIVGSLRSAAGVLALASALAVSAPSSALAKSKKSRHPPSSGTVQKKGATKTTYRASPSQETRAERERRLYRECKGMHNAGACKGFTRR